MEIKINQNYYTDTDLPQFVCCGEVQDTILSRVTDKVMGCQFCEFDLYE
jgi:hypothetical protein